MFVIMSVSVWAVVNPSAVFCEELGYDYNIDESTCVFPDGSHCKGWKFYEGECGSEWYEEVSCREAGEALDIGECCNGLEKIKNRNIFGDNCQQSEAVGGSMHVCSDCGNGVCEEWESICNCPDDCGDCIDSDGGLNYYEKGKTYVVSDEEGYPVISYYDQCQDCVETCFAGGCYESCSSVQEFYCEDDGIMPESHSCENGCMDGACLKPECSLYTFYTDTCPHCGEDYFEYLHELDEKYSNLKIIRYNVQSGGNNDIFEYMLEKADENTRGVPCFIVDDKAFLGFSDEITKDVEEQLDEICTKSTFPVIDSFAGPKKLQTGETGTWTVKAHDLDSDYLIYSFNWGENPEVADSYEPSKNPSQTGTFTHTYRHQGRYTVKVTVKDEEGNSAEATSTVRVSQDNSCWSNRDCSSGEFCEYHACLAETGRCVEKPEMCTEHYSPVCGCDGMTYSNDCFRKAAGVSKKADGKCGTAEADLAHYPRMFIDGDMVDTIIVVGETAPTSDMLAAIDISASLQQYADDNKPEPPTATSSGGEGAGSTVTTTDSSKVVSAGVSKIEVLPQGMNVLDTEVKTINQNMVTVGSPCSNTVTHRLMSQPNDCTGGTSKGVGKIKLYTRGNHVQLVVTGYSDEEIKMAAKVLSDFDEYDLSGDEVCVFKEDGLIKTGACDSSDDFRVELSPYEISASPEEWVTYNLKITDEHELVRCSGSRCYREYDYDISIRGTPDLRYEEEVSVEQGESEEFKIGVRGTEKGRIPFTVYVTGEDGSTKSVDGVISINGGLTGDVSLNIKDTYNKGEVVSIELTNNYNVPITYQGGCMDTFSIQKNGEDLDITNPCMARCLGISLIDIEPGESKTIGAWNQKYFVDCNEKNAEAGTYTATVAYSVNNEHKRVSKTFRIIDSSQECNGCVRDGKCLPYGTRLLDEESVYCSVSGNFETQKPNGKSCQNSYECESNFCSNGNCVDLEGQLSENRNLMQKILDWLQRLFG